MLSSDLKRLGSIVTIFSGFDFIQLYSKEDSYQKHSQVQWKAHQAPKNISPFGRC